MAPIEPSGSATPPSIETRLASSPRTGIAKGLGIAFAVVVALLLVVIIGGYIFISVIVHKDQRNALDDVKIVSCGITYQNGNPYAQATVEITNHTDVLQNYEVSATFSDSDSSLPYQGLVDTDVISPDQPTIVLVVSDETVAMGKITCGIDSVDRV